MEPYIIYASLAAVFVTAYTIYIRSVLRKGGDSVAFTVIVDFIAGLVLLPILLREGMRFEVASLALLALLVIITLLTALSDTLFVKGRQLEEASAVSVIAQFGLVWIFIGSVIFLGESFTALKLAGVVLIIVGNLIRSIEPSKLTFSKGTKIVFLATFVWSSISLLSKYLLRFISATLLQAILFFGGAFWVFAYTRFDTVRLKKELRHQGISSLIAGTMFGLFLLFILKAIEAGEVSRVYPIYQLNVIFSVLFGILILGEKTSLMRKIVSMAMVFAGILLIVRP